MRRCSSQLQNRKIYLSCDTVLHNCKKYRIPLKHTTKSSIKIFYKKQRPEIIHYRNYKNFENSNFHQDLKKELLKCDVTNTPLLNFNDNVLTVLDKRNCNFMTNKLRKAIMTRSKLRNKILKTGSEESRSRFYRQRNFCVSLLHKTKRRFFGN